MHGRAPRSQGGYSLLEMIVVLAIVGSLVGALASGLLTSATVTNHAKDRQRLGFAMTSFTEVLRNFPYYQSPEGLPCDEQGHIDAYTARYEQYVLDLPPGEAAPTQGMSWQITDIDFWTPQPNPTAGPPVADQWAGGCAPDEDGGVQRLAVRLALPSNTGGRSMTGEVVVACRCGPDDD